MDEYDYDEMEDQQDKQEDYDDAMEEKKRSGMDEYEMPQQRESESLYNLFHRVLKLKDSSKVGNLDKPELGMLNMSVRDSQRIALLAHKLNHDNFASFFVDQGEIILRTSGSKKGWFTELFVSQKKAKSSSQSVEVAQPQKKKFGLFGGRQ